MSLWKTRGENSGKIFLADGVEIDISKIFEDNSLVIRSKSQLGEFGNVWKEEFTGKPGDGDTEGFSKSVDTGNLPHVSIMGEIENDSEIQFFASPDNEHFYFCDRITKTIGPVPSGEVVNHANDTTKITASQTDAGNPANLIEGETGIWQANEGGDLSGSPVWLQYDCETAKRVTEVDISIGVSFRAPSKLAFYGTDDTDTWGDALAEFENLVWQDHSTRTFSLDNNDDYRYYKIEILEVPAPNRVQLAEIRLLEEVGESTVFPKQFHIYPTLGARYIKLRSTQNVKATVSVIASP